MATRSRRNCDGSSGSSDDDRNCAAVGAPGGAGDVRRTIRAEEGHDGGNLLGLGQPTQRSPFPHGLEHFVARLPPARGVLVREPALAAPPHPPRPPPPVPPGCRPASPPSPSHAFVAVGPGATALHRIPSPA